MDYTNEQIKAAAEHCIKTDECYGCILQDSQCTEQFAIRLLALESEAADLKKQLAESEKREKAMLKNVKQSCDTCMHSKKQSCPWEGTYHHKDEYGKEIGVCNAWQ